MTKRGGRVSEKTIISGRKDKKKELQIRRNDVLRMKRKRREGL